MRRHVFALVLVLGAAAWLASVAAACHSEITGTMSCSGAVSYTASAWNEAGASDAQRTNSDVRVWASTDNGKTYAEIGRGSFSKSNGFQFSGTWQAGSASSVTLKVQEQAHWGNGDAPAPPRYVTVTPPSNCGGGGSQCNSASMLSSSSPISASGSTASESFTVAQGCSLELSLVSYTSAGQYYRSVHETQVSGGQHTWTVAVPSCGYVVDFVYGAPITSGTPNYGGRLIRTMNGGSGSCTTTPPPTVPPTAPPTAPPGAPSSPPPAAVPAPTVSLVKLERVGTTGSYAAGPVSAPVGSTVYYELVATNTGSTTISVTLADDGCDAQTLAPTGPQAILPGASLTYTCSHTLVAGDGSAYVNTALVTASNAGPQTATATASATANIAPAAGVAGVTKTVTKKATKHAKAKHAKVKKVVKHAKAARAVIHAADFTG